jgi:hypothetical protein
VLYHIDFSPNLPLDVMVTNVLVWEEKEWPAPFFEGGNMVGGGARIIRVDWSRMAFELCQGTFC